MIMKQVWKATGKIFACVGSKWRPIGRKFTLGDTYPLTRITKPEVVPLEKPGSVSTSEPANNIIVTPRFSKKPLTSYKCKDRKLKYTSIGSPPNAETKDVNDPVNANDLSANQRDPNKIGYLMSQILQHPQFSNLINYVEKFIGMVRFGNHQFAAIIGYGDYNIGDTIITRVYYVEGLSHNLFSVGQFCDAGLEVAFRKYTCYIRNKDKVDLLKVMVMASNHLNFRTLNELARKDLVRDLSKLKYEKEHLCPSCQLGKSKKSSHPLKIVNTNTEVLNTLHMDLCGPMRVKSINGKKYILVIVYDYTQFGWVRFLRTKDETPEVIKKFIILMQRALNATVRYLRTDNGTEFVNKTLTKFYESVGITHNTSVPRTPQQNDVVKRRNRTLMEAARTMLIFAKAPMFLWAEAVATACYTCNIPYFQKYGLDSSTSVDTPMVEKMKLDEDRQGTLVDPTRFCGMVGSLMYLSASKTLILFFEVCGVPGIRQSLLKNTYMLSNGSFDTLKEPFTWGDLSFNKIPLYCDNQSAIALCCNNVQHSRSKHIDIRHHFIKEQVENSPPNVETKAVNDPVNANDLSANQRDPKKIRLLTAYDW
ncbi:retrovirus-related pol polyprotein from transposon TNT 1-94 [Tanacetum coccineum]